MAEPADPPRAARGGSGRPLADRFAWAALAGMLLLQYLLFRGHVHSEVAPFYPRMFDQAAYLATTYGLHEAVRDQGLAAAPGLIWARRLPQSLLFTGEAALFLFLAGASRLGALTFVFLHFSLLQVALAALLRRLSGGWSVPALGLGLLLSARTAFAWGGLADFRIDLSAACVAGIWLCLVLESDCLAKASSWLPVGAAALYLALFRYVAIPQVLGTLGLFAAYSFWALRRADPDQRSLTRRRLRNVLAALALAGLGVAGVLAANLELLRGYYWAGQHLAADQHSFGLTGSAAWLYYFDSLARVHTGRAFLALAALTLVAVALLARRAPPPVERREAQRLAFDVAPAAVILSLSVAVPMVVLTLNPARSPIVAGGVLPALVLLLSLAPLWLACRGLGPGARRALGGLGAGALAVGLATQADALVRRQPAAERAQSGAATALLESVARVCREMDWRRPVVLFDTTTEFQQPWALAVVAYEQERFLIEPVVPIGAPAFQPVKPAAVRQAFQAADFALLARRRPAWFVPNFAFDQSLEPLRGALLRRAGREMELVGRREVGGWTLEFYVRPSARMEEPALPAGSAWTWITDRGLKLRTTVGLLRARSLLRLSGAARLDYLGGALPGLRATLLPEDGPPRPLHVSGRSSGVLYTIDIRGDVTGLPDGGPVAVQLDFDRSFSPREIGLANDDRRLVMASPTLIRLLRPGDAREAVAGEAP